MRRTNVVLDEKLLEDARKILGLRTYSDTVNVALREAIRLKRIQRIPEFFGSGFWEGNLSEMREDGPRTSATTKKRKRTR